MKPAEGAQESETYRTAADQAERYARDRAEHKPAYGQKYNKARDSYRDARELSSTSGD